MHDGSVPYGFEVPQFVSSLLENFDICLIQMRLDPDPNAHLHIIRNLYVHDLLLSAILALNMQREKEALIRDLSLKLEILQALTNPIDEELKN
jgi:hypothetical protein